MSKQIQKMAVAGLLIALGVTLSTFSIPIGASRCFPVQHMINILAGVVLGPWYAVGMAFLTSLLRFMLGTGTLLAFPGSMVGALCCGLLYQGTRKLWAAYAGELVGTSVLGGVLCYPVAVFLMGREAALFAYVLPFFISSLSGTVIAGLALGTMQRMGILNRLLSHNQSNKATHA